MANSEWRMANSNCCAYHSLFPIRHSRLFTKKNRAITARLSSPAWGRRRHLPEGNSCLHYGCHLGGWGNRIASQRDDYASALPAAQRDAPHASHAKGGKVFASFMQPSEARHTPEAGQGRLKIPALRLGDQEIAERLNARHRFQLFRIDK